MRLSGGDRHKCLGRPAGFRRSGLVYPSGIASAGRTVSAGVRADGDPERDGREDTGLSVPDVGAETDSPLCSEYVGVLCRYWDKR